MLDLAIKSRRTEYGWSVVPKAVTEVREVEKEEEQKSTQNSL